MILHGNQRGGARDLATHLVKPENEHVELHEIRGFVATTLSGALSEAEAVSRGTQCRQFLYSLSLSPPATASVPVSVFEDAIERVERKLGLEGHSRLVVFHEKEGRRHAHCVWSRIDPVSMKAVRMSHDRMKLGDISRELYFDYGWKMPQGLIDPALRNPLNFGHREWMKAKRAGRDPRDIKAAFQQCWAASDSGAAFRQALQERGLYVAKGDRRGVVAVDTDGSVYAVARWTDVKSKQVVARIGDLDALPSVDAVQEHLRDLTRVKLTGFLGNVIDDFARAANALESRRIEMTEKHRAARSDLVAAQEARWIDEARHRTKRFRRGILGLWDRITGRHSKLHHQNESETAACAKRDSAERQALIDAQRQERQRLQQDIDLERRAHARELARLNRYLAASSSTRTSSDAEEDDRRRTRQRVGPTLG